MSEKPPPAASLDLNDKYVKHLRNVARKQVTEEKQQDRPQKDTVASPSKRASPDPAEPPERKRIKTPERTSPAAPVSATPTPNSRHQRTKGRASDPADFEAVPRERKKLWHDGTRGPTKPPAPPSRGGHHNSNPRGTASGPAHRRGQGPNSFAGGPEPPGDVVNELQKQPETRPISQEQLIAEVKGIYSGLVMVESRCIEVDTAQSSLNDSQDAPKLTDDQWQALISLHRALLHEHHDFFLASQHPSAGPALRRLASKYAMPARMWRHGIHSFLELLRHRLPSSSEYMVSFIYLAYSMMALLYETVPAFDNTWIECLGDLSRYRMAIEDDDVHDRNVWTAVSRSWYSKASDKAPTTGRLHHHLAILARPDVVAQLFFYLKSLTVAIPFKSARDSILTLFEPIMSGAPSKVSVIDQAFIRVHGVFFTNKNEHLLEAARDEFFKHLDAEISRTNRRWLELGYQIALSNIAAVLGHGNVSNALMKAIAASRPEDAAADAAMEGAADDEIEWPLRVQQAVKFAADTDQIVMARLGDLNILSYLHVRLFFLYTMSDIDSAMSRLESSVPWHLLTLSLNSFMADLENPEAYEAPEFPTTPTKPLPEDWALRGLVWTENAFPAKHFNSDTSEDDERMFETPSLGDHRRERSLWLACRIAEKNKWIQYDRPARRFSPLPKYEKANVETRPVAAEVAHDEEMLPDADAAGVAGGEGASSDRQRHEPATMETTPVPVTIIQADRSSPVDK